ncbi:hypothetical protein ABPG74_006980 [Tetrahymena malaccensis]
MGKDFNKKQKIVKQDKEINVIEDEEKKSKKKKGGGFESMNLVYPVYKAIKNRGFNMPTPIQRKAIPLILEGRDVVACSRTGSGKTAAFIIPLINKLQNHSRIVGARALIVVPTRELALQIASVLKTFIKFTDLTYTLIVGGHGLEGQFESLASNPDIIIATPGRLSQLIDETDLSLNKVEFLIFDECDYLFEMGFADQMKTILKKVSQQRQTLMFSATIPEELSAFARAGLKEYVFVKLDSEFTINENITLNFILTRNNEKIASLVHLLKSVIPAEENSIVFASTKYHVDLICAILDKFNVSNVSIYGKMDAFARRDQINEFRMRKCNVMVVTDLASRGIDLPNVNNVIHYDYPASTKIFIHRSGRTARAGRKGNTYALMGMNEIMYVSEIMVLAGRKLSNNVEDMKDTSKAIYGAIPVQLISEEQAKIQILLKEDIEINKMQQLANNAYIQFNKSRSSASKASIKDSYQVKIDSINPLFHKFAEDEKEKMDYLSKIKNYKPAISALEIYKQRSLKNQHGTDDPSLLENANSLARSVADLKKQEQMFKDKKERIEKINKIKMGIALQNEGEKMEIENNKQAAEEEEEYVDEGLLDEELVKKMNEAEQEFEEDEDDEKLINDEPEIKQKEEAQEQYIIEHKPKKIKKSQMVDFKNKDQYIEAQPDYNKPKKSIEDDNKISTSDVNAFVVAEDYEDLLRNKKKMIWDKKKKQFVFGKTDEVGRVVRDKEDKNKNGKKGKVAKEMLKKWEKKNQIKLQRDGEQEDSTLVDRVRGMFKKRTLRQKGIYLPEDNQEKQQKGVKSELKSHQQILKQKKITKGLKFKNMEKGKRNQIINKKKQASAMADKKGGFGKPKGGFNKFKGGKGGKGGKFRR